MKIVIYVDYSNAEFNNDFKISNVLINKGHNVFLAVNDTQFNELTNKCDLSFLGLSAISKKSTYPNVELIDNNIII